MRRYISTLLILAVVVALVIAMSGCPNGDNGTSTGSSDDGKIPITTSSEEAKQEFLKGRDLAEKLQLQDSLQHYDKAISLDPNFALAELGRANASQTAKDFFDHLEKAVSLVSKVSEGEKLLILANEAGSNGEVVIQKDYLDKLVAAHPNDERAQFSIGGYYFGQQDYTTAIEHYKKATEINPTFSPVYNILGYAYRQKGDYANAETAFKKYIELIPKDPNPYDSYGELLLKMGKFDASIEQYQKALAIDSNFTASNVGIAANLMYQGKPEEAKAELQKIMDKARSDGDRTTALAGMTVVDLDSGDMVKAIEHVDKQFELAEKTKDAAAMAGSLQSKGTILLEMGKYDEARAEYEKAVKVTNESDLSQEIKDNTKLFNNYNMARLALAEKDMEAAKKAADEFKKGAAESKNPSLIRQSHELAGMIAFAEKDYDKAISELDQSSQQNPYNLYRLAKAYQEKGDEAKMKEFAKKASEFYSLPQINYAFIRSKAKEMTGES